MQNDTKFLIWDSEYSGYLACVQAIESLREEYPDATDDQLMRMAYESNEEQLNIERETLSAIKPVNGILAVARLGLWSGHPLAVLPGSDRDTLQTVADCLKSFVQSDTDICFYLNENGDLSTRETHHDGTNIYTFRAWKPGVTDEQKEALLDDIYEQKPDAFEQVQALTTRLGDDIAAIYGWDIPAEDKPDI